MKHIFYVHSYVTYLVSLGIIDYYGIDDSDVCIFCTRFKINQTRFRCISIDTIFKGLCGLPAYGTRFLYIKKRVEIFKLDNFIKNITKGCEYICYLPSDGHYLQQLIGSHILCSQVHYIEEGLFSYNDDFRKKSLPFRGKFSQIKRYLNTGGRNILPHEAERKSILFTLFDEKHYSGNLRKKCISLDLNALEYDGLKLQHSAILVMNAFRDADDDVIGAVLSVLERFASTFSNNDMQLYIKHHPYSSDKFILQVESVFKNCDIDFHIIDNSVNLELLMFNSTDLYIYGFFSASMMYGALWGHTVHSFIEEFSECSESCKEYLSLNFHVPEMFYDSISSY